MSFKERRHSNLEFYSDNLFDELFGDAFAKSTKAKENLHRNQFEKARRSSDELAGLKWNESAINRMVNSKETADVKSKRRCSA